MTQKIEEKIDEMKSMFLGQIRVIQEDVKILNEENKELTSKVEEQEKRIKVLERETNNKNLIIHALKSVNYTDYSDYNNGRKIKFTSRKRRY